MSVKTLILDDEKEELKRIKNLLQECRKTEFFCQCISSPEDVDYSVCFDLYIIDIDLGNGRNGFSVAQTIVSSFPFARLVFCTSHEEMVFESFNLPVFYFLRKEHLANDMNGLFNKLQKANRTAGIYLLNYAGVTASLSYDDILYIDVLVNDLYIHTVQGEELHERKTLKAILEQLPQDRFVQISKHTAINLSYVKCLYKGKVLLRNGVTLEMVSEREKNIREKYMQLVTGAI